MEEDTMRASRRLIFGATLVAGTVLATTGLDAVRSHSKPVSLISLATAATDQVADSTPNPLSQAFRRATGNAMPGVVFIDVEQRRGGGADPLAGTPFEGMSPNGPQVREGSGSGFVFRPDGYIITNNHVVEGATRVTVVLQDRREYAATVVGRDPSTDIAVVKIDARGLPVIPLANSDQIEVGDWAVALGYPLQLGVTATAGIVSAKGRSLGILSEGGTSSPVEYYIQTDAAINPGNSGGPLVDLQGRVIGVNSAIKSPTGYYSGYGFAVPSNIAARVVKDLIERGTVRRPLLGVSLDDISAADAAVYKLPRVAGAEIIMSPLKGSAAAKAGLRMGDVIIGINGKNVDTDGELRERLALFQPGDNIAVDVVRYGQRLKMDVSLGESDAVPVVNTRPAQVDDRGISKLGFEATQMTPQIARQLSASTTTGVVVYRVEPASPAAHADLVPGYLLKSINGQAVRTVDDVVAIGNALKPGEAVSLMLAAPNGRERILNYQVRN
ncbi:MAG: trypsin-like peptidase domain-containing protein [Longimicrobiales bacterium]